MVNDIKAVLTENIKSFANASDVAISSKNALLWFGFVMKFAWFVKLFCQKFANEF